MIIKRFKVLLITFICILIVNINLFAEEEGKAGVILPILNYMAGTRAMGLGTAYTALSDEITSLYWNPSGLARLTRQQVYGLYERLYEGSTYWFAGYSIPFHRLGVFGVGIIILSTGDIEGYDPLGAPLGVYSDTQSMLIISYGAPLDNIKKFKSRHFRFLDIGASLKLVKHTIYEYSSYGIALDIGAKYIPLKTTRILRDFIFGMVLQNILPPGIKLDKERDWYPLKLKLGTCYRTLYDTLFLSMDMNYIMFREQTPEFNV